MNCTFCNRVNNTENTYVRQDGRGVCKGGCIMKCSGCSSTIGSLQPYIKIGPDYYCCNPCARSKVIPPPTIYGKRCYFIVTMYTISSGDQLVCNYQRVTIKPDLVGIRREIPEFPEFEMDENLYFVKAVGAKLFRIQPIHSCD